MLESGACSQWWMMRLATKGPAVCEMRNRLDFRGTLEEWRIQRYGLEACAE